MKKYEVITTNPIKVRKYIKTKEKNIEVLTNLKDKKAKKFLKKYDDVLHSFSPKKFQEFHDETGLYITHTIYEKGVFNGIKIDSTGLLINSKIVESHNNRYEEDDYKIFRDDIEIVSYVDKIDYDDIGIYINNDNTKYIYSFIDDTPTTSIGYHTILHDGFNTEIEEKIKYIKEKIDEDFFHNIDESKIINIFQAYPFNEIYIHLNNGILYENKKIYSEDIRDLRSLNIANIFIIHNDNSIEYLKHSLHTNNEIKYKKILYGDIGDSNIFAQLEDNGNLSILCQIDYASNRYICNYFENIDDIELNLGLHSLSLIKGNEKIEFFSGFIAEY